ncbi:MAG: DUF433 domain-containing protein [Anaerolineales bacterium]|nr:DUF433 domain-containing protein [Anaerolineales bacterium]
MNWQEHIHSDPKILNGKPVVKGTRLSVEFLLGLVAAGWTKDQVLENYPTLLEDCYDLLLARQRENEPTESLEEVRQHLIAAKKLQA